MPFWRRIHRMRSERGNGHAKSERGAFSRPEKFVRAFLIDLNGVGSSENLFLSFLLGLTRHLL